jgi:hypothetical protein
VITVQDLLTFRIGFEMLMATPDAYPILSALHLVVGSEWHGGGIA